MTPIRKPKPLKRRGTKEAEESGESEKSKALPRISADDRGSGRPKTFETRRITPRGTEEAEESAGSRIQLLASKYRNMPRHPLVPKDYAFMPNFARDFRYTEQALVYSGLLAGSAAFAGGSVAFV
jgi:hypothetical protein